jgi:hypothetical protein
MPEPLNQPPMSGIAPPLSCGRLLRWPDESSRCPNDATHHIIWTPECENTIDCDAHVQEVLDLGHEFVAIHPYTLTCSMDGAMFVQMWNRCAMPDELDHLEAEAPLIRLTEAIR